MVEFEGRGLSSLSVVALRRAMEARMGLGWDGLRARRHEISSLARSMAEQLRRTEPAVLTSGPAMSKTVALEGCADQSGQLLRASATAFSQSALLER